MHTYLRITYEGALHLPTKSKAPSAGGNLPLNGPFLLPTWRSVPRYFSLASQINSTNRHEFSLHILSPGSHLNTTNRISFIRHISLITRHLSRHQTRLSLFRFNQTITTTRIKRISYNLQIRIPIRRTSNKFNSMFSSLQTTKKARNNRRFTTLTVRGRN